jgi:integrase
MTGSAAARVEDYLALRRSLGYRSRGQERYLRAFAGYLDRAGHHGPIPLAASMDWATSTTSADPCNPARWLTVVRGLLRHLTVLDGATEVPAPGLLGPTGHRKPPPVYSSTTRSLTCCRPRPRWLRAGDCARIATPPCSACSPGLRICEALALLCADVDLTGGMLTVRVGKRGRTRLVPLHPSVLAPLRDYAAQREQHYGPPVATTRSSAPTAATTSATTLPAAPSECCAGNAAGAHRGALGHDLRHRMVVRRIQSWHAQDAEVDRKIAVLATLRGPPS